MEAKKKKKKREATTVTWELDPATANQLSFLTTLGHKGEAPKTKGEACTQIQSMLKNVPPTQSQLDYLFCLEHKDEAPRTKDEAASLIRKILKEREQAKQEREQREWEEEQRSGVILSLKRPVCLNRPSERTIAYTSTLNATEAKLGALQTNPADTPFDEDEHDVPHWLR